MINKAFILLALCLTATATAAPVPPAIPVVKRPKPLLSPAHAAAPKSKPMVRATSGVSDPYPTTRVTLKGSVVKVVSQFGTYEFTVELAQPAGQSLLFEKADILGEWVPLGYFGPQPTEQQSFAAYYSFNEFSYVRANLTPVPATATMKQTGWMPASLVPAIGSHIYRNPDLPGARAWSVKK